MSSDETAESVERRHVQTDSHPSGASSRFLLSGPSTRTVASLTVSLFLFGGLALLVGGATWAVLSVFGLPVAVAVAGTGMIAYAFVLAQVLTRVGLF